MFHDTTYDIIKGPYGCVYETFQTILLHQIVKAFFFNSLSLKASQDGVTEFPHIPFPLLSILTLDISRHVFGLGTIQRDRRLQGPREFQRCSIIGH